ncbi:MAG: hypothetical protein ACJATT_000431 [Myxococcota bacterium]|jgi:hypothetical protein
MTWLLLLASALAQDACMPEASQDLNCNLVDASDEGLVDTRSSLCASAIASDPRAANIDAWFDYNTLGCTVSVLALDEDADGFGHGGLEFVDDDGRPYLEVTLRCDACPNSADDQLDTDCDGIGDACDVCPEDSTDTADTDGDGWGDACDPCPGVANESSADADTDGTPDDCDVCPDLSDDQADRDTDGIGDVCDACPDDVEPGRDTDNDGIIDICGPVFRLGGGASCSQAPHLPSWMVLFTVVLVRRRR